MKNKYVKPANEVSEISVQDGVLTTGSPQSISYKGSNSGETDPKAAETREWEGNSGQWDSEW